MNDPYAPCKYKHNTRIGNWSEEWELEETKRKDYLKQKKINAQKGNTIEKKLLKSYQPASLSLSKDGFIHFGDHIMLYNGKTQGFLAADTSQRLFKTQENYYSSTVQNLHACARSVFIIQRYNLKDGFQDDTLHYGQQFRIRLNPLLIGKDKPIYLHSQYTNQRKHSPISKMQQVTWFLNETYNTVWCFQNVNPSVRFQSLDSGVGASDNVLIKHLFTNQWLASDTQKYKNGFGQQFQVMVNNFYVKSKVQGLSKQKKGQTTNDIPLRGQTLQNLWVIVNARDSSQNFDQSVIRQTISKGALMQKVKALLSTGKGIYALRFLAKIYQNMDINKDFFLDLEDFRWGLQSANVFLTAQEYEVLDKQLKNEEGYIKYPQFLEQLRGKVSQKRVDIIASVYNIIKSRLGEKLTVEELGKMYDAKRHPEVLKGKRDEKSAFSQFVAHWNFIQPDYFVNWQQFLNYYQDISATIPRDDHFQFLLVSVWHL